MANGRQGQEERRVLCFCPTPPKLVCLGCYLKELIPGVSPHSSGDWKLNVKVLSGLVFSLPGLQMAVLLLPLSLGVYTPDVSSDKNTKHIELEATLTASV